MITRDQDKQPIKEENPPFLSSSDSSNSNSSYKKINQKQNMDFGDQFQDDTNVKKESRSYDQDDIKDTLKKQSNKKSKMTKQNLKVEEFEECLLHKKPLDILCLIEKDMICSSCALFGNHKGHEFRNSQDLEKDSIKRQQLVLNLIQKKASLDKDKIEFLDPHVIEKLLKQKKQQLIGKLTAEVEKLLRQIKECQINCLIKIEEELKKSKQKYQGMHIKLISARKQYNHWQQLALIHVQALHKSKTIQQKVKNLKEYCPQPSLIKEGKCIISNLEMIFKEAEKEKIRCLNNVEIVMDTSFLNKLKYFAKVETIYERELNLVFNIENTKENNISLSSIENMLDEPLITEENRHNIRNQASLLSLETSMRSIGSSPLYKSSMALSPKREKLMRQEMNSQTKNRLRSPTKPETPMQIARYRRIKLKLPEKYDKIMEEVLSDTTQIFDLTNGELGNEMTLQMLDLLKTNLKVRIIKLAKNKINDDILPLLWKNLTRIQTLNLSNNSLSEKILDSFMGNLALVPALKNIVLTQNKMVPRALKSKVQQLKQIGILVTL